MLAVCPTLYPDRRPAHDSRIPVSVNSVYYPSTGNVVSSPAVQRSLSARKKYGDETTGNDEVADMFMCPFCRNFSAISYGSVLKHMSRTFISVSRGSRCAVTSVPRRTLNCRATGKVCTCALLSYCAFMPLQCCVGPICIENTVTSLPLPLTIMLMVHTISWSFIPMVLIVCVEALHHLNLV